MNIRTVLTTTLLGLGIAAAPTMALADVIGYYEMCEGAGNANQASRIVAAGHTPVNVLVPDAATLGGLDVLFVTNCSNGGYGGEYLEYLSAINNAVQAGGLNLIVHDRYVTGASTILPGVIGVRNFDDGSNIDFPVGSPIITGPGGTLTNSSLDGGNSSSHGYVLTGTMPAGSQTLAHTSDPTHAVTFRYAWGAGQVIYSTIPLDYYLGGNSPVAMSAIYAPNVIGFGASYGFTTCAAEGFFGGRLSLCHKICQTVQTPSNLAIAIKLYRLLYKTDPPCAF